MAGSSNVCNITSNVLLPDNDQLQLQENVKLRGTTVGILQHDRTQRASTLLFPPIYRRQTCPRMQMQQIHALALAASVHEHGYLSALFSFKECLRKLGSAGVLSYTPPFMPCDYT